MRLVRAPRLRLAAPIGSTLGTAPRRRALLAALALLAVLALPMHARAGDATLAPFSAAGPGAPPPPWRFAGLPRQRAAATRFELEELDGRRVLAVRTEASYGTLVHPLAAAPPGTLTWRWRVDRLIESADITTRAGDDGAVKVCALFDLPLARVPFLERQMLRLARRASGEALPTATLCYLWDNRLPVGTVIANAYTRRVRFIVLESGPARLGRWMSETRPLAADFRRAFGEESEAVPALTAILVGADGDNTGGSALAYVSDITLAGTEQNPP